MTDEGFIIAVLVGTIRAGTPLVFAALGELITEKAGVLNLGLEGMMLVGAVAGFIGTVVTGSIFLGIVFAVVASVIMSLIFGVLTLSLMANQVATGLALTIFGIGLSAFIGLGYIGTPIEGLKPVSIPVLSEIPILGPLLFKYDLMIYFSIVMFALVTWFLYRSRAGLILRAVGESHDAAHGLGYSVIKIRYLAVMFGGAMSGLGGAYLSLVYTPQWAENMTAGRGWIALALVVFATWRPPLVLFGAWLFGGITILGLHQQASGAEANLHWSFQLLLGYLVATLFGLASALVFARDRYWKPTLPVSVAWAAGGAALLVVFLVFGNSISPALWATCAVILALNAWLFRIAVRRTGRLHIALTTTLNFVWLLAALSLTGIVLGALGVEFTSHLIAIVPYVATILALVAISWDRTISLLNTPASLGKPFHPSS